MELARALDELYAGTPDQFTARRDAIVKEMKAAGDKDAAAQLAKRRKPTQVAYVLNQLARKHPDEVAAFVDVGRDLARAHRKALRGDGGDLTKAIAAQRTAVKDLTALVGDLVHELNAGDAVLAEVAGALQAALVDPTAAAALEEGQLEKAPEAPTMLGFGEDIAPQEARPERRTPSSRDRPRRAPEDDRKRAAAEQRARAQEERERAKAERERAEEERSDLEAAAERAEQLADERAATAKELTEEAERLEKAARALAEQAQVARDEAERAREEAKEARARVPAKAKRRKVR
jgi:hypothetical protein